MSSITSILKNSTYLMGGHLITKAINFLLLLVLTAYLGTSGFGLYSFALSYATIFMILTNLGINTYVVTVIAPDKTKAVDLINSTLPIIIVLSVLTLTVSNAIPILSGWDEQERVIVLLVTVFVILDASSRYCMSIFRAFEKMEYEAALNVFEKVGLLLVTLISWYYNFSMELLLGCFIFIELLKAVLGYFYIFNRIIDFRLNLNYSKIFTILKLSLPFALVTIFTSISVKIDVVMLKLMQGDSIAGLYSTGRRIIESTLFLPETFSTALFPVLVVLYKQNQSEFKSVYLKALKVIVIVALPIVLLIFTFSPQIVNLLFSPEFKDAYISLRWLSIALGILFLRYYLLTLMNSVNKQKIYSLIVGIGTLLNISLNYYLIPISPFIGASFATIISELVIVMLTAINLRNLFEGVFFNLRSINFLLITTLVSLFLFFTQTFNFILISVAALIIYTISVFGFGIVSKEEYLYLKNIVFKYKRRT